MMAAALTLNRLGVSDRELHGYDTYEGMPEPSAQDRSSAYDGYSIHKRWRAHNRSGRAWAGAGSRRSAKRWRAPGIRASAST